MEKGQVLVWLNNEGGGYLFPDACEPRSEGEKGPRNQQPQLISLTFSSDGHQLDPFAGYEIQGFVDVGDLVHSHLASLRLGQAFT